MKTFTRFANIAMKKIFITAEIIINHFRVMSLQHSIARLIVLLIIFMISGSEAMAANRYSVNNGNWNSTAVWASTSGGTAGQSVPVAGDVVYIESGDNVTVTADAACSSITFTNNGATLTVNSGFTLMVSGAVTMNSSTSNTRANTITGSGILTCGSVAVGTDISPSNYGTVTTTLTSSISALTISGDLTIYSNYTNSFGGRYNNATFNLSTGTVTVNGSVKTTNEIQYGTYATSTLSLATGTQNGVLKLGGGTPFSLGAGNNTINLNGTGSNVTYNYAGGQTVYNTPYHDLTLTGSGAKTLGGATTVNGVLTVKAGTTLALSTFALGSPTSTILECGATTGSIISGSGVLTLGGDVTVNNVAAGTSGATISCPVALGGNRTFSIADDGTVATDLAISGVMSGNYGIIKADAGTLVLSAANTFTNTVTINAGILSANTLASANTVSSLGTGGGSPFITIAGGGTLQYTGSGHSTNRQIILSGSGATIDASGTGMMTLSGGVTGNTMGLVLTGNGTGNESGVIGTTTGTLTKNGSGTWTLSGNNTYTGATTINAGILQLGLADRIANTSNVVLGGGIFKTGASAGFSETVGALALTDNSTIALGTGVHTLTFANSNSTVWTSGKTLTITGWTGTAGSSGTSGKIVVGTGGLTAAQLSQIQFTGYNLGAVIVSGEVVPVSAPILAITVGATNLGSSCIGTAAASITYTITNTGATANGVTVASNNSQFVVNGAPNTVTGGSSATYNVTFIPASSGPQSATITVASTTSGSNSPTSSLTGTGLALPVAGAITGGNAVCMGGTLALASHATGTGTLTYTWASSDVTKATVSSTGVVSPVAPGTTNITYVVVDGTTLCSATSANYAVTVNPLPLLTVVEGNSISGCTQVNLLSAVTDHSGDLYYYPSGSSNILPLTAQTSVITEGYYRIQAKIEDCTTEKEVYVKINDKPTIMLVDPLNMSVCQGVGHVELAYSGSSGAPTTYSIVFDQGGFANVEDEGLYDSPLIISVPYTITAGTYTGMLTVKNGTSCVSEGYPIAIKVHPAPSVTWMSKVVCPGIPTGIVLPLVDDSPDHFSITKYYITSDGLSGQTDDLETISPNAISGDILFNNSTEPITNSYFVIPYIGDCKGSGFYIDVTVQPAPEAPTAHNNLTAVYTGVEQTATATTASGSHLAWFTTQTGSTTAYEAPSGTNAGTYVAWAESVDNNTGCVSATRTEVTLTIGKAPLAVTATAPDIIYGDDAPVVTLSYNGFVHGEDHSVIDNEGFFLATDYMKGHSAGTYNTIISIGSASDNNYECVLPLNSSTFKVDKASLTVTAVAENILYGSTGPSVTVSISGLISPDGLEDLDNVGFVLGTDYTKGDPAGTYNTTIAMGTATDNNYSFTSLKTSTFVVGPSPLIITAENENKEYDGSAYGPFTVSYNGFVNFDDPSKLTGTLAFTGSAITAINAGNDYVITPSGLTSDNYTINFVDGKLDITKKELTITADPQVKTYDGKTFTDGGGTFTSTIAGFVNSESISVVMGNLTYTGAAITATNAGDFSITPVISGLSATNYSFTGVNGTLTIGKIDPDIVVASYDVPYDALPHTATVTTATGVNGENFTADIVLTGTTHTDANTYATDLWSFAGNTNYNPANGTITDKIGKIDPNIVVASYDVPYDAQPHTATVTTATGVNSENFTADIVLTGTTHTDANTYATDSWSFAGNTNYNAAVGTITDKIGKINPTIVVKGFTGPYDALPHSAHGSATGLNNEVLTGLDLGNSYTNVPGGTAHWTFTNDNYASQEDDVVINIGKVDITVIANSTNKTYGSLKTYDGTEFTTSGTFYNGDKITKVTLSSTGDAAIAAVNTYPIVASTAAGLGLNNYNIHYTNGTLTVGQKDLVVSAKSDNKEFSSIYTFFGTEFTTNGLVNSDAVNSVTLSSAGAAVGAAVGQYDILISDAIGSGLENYNIAYAKGALNVQDNTPPQAKCKSAIVQLDAAGNGSIVVNDIDNGSTDASGIKSRTLSKTAFNCMDFGQNTVILTVTDNNNLVSTCNAIVTVEDNVAPAIVCSPDLTVNASLTACNANVDAGVPSSYSDACGIKSVIGTRSDNGTPLTLTNHSGIFSIGTTYINWTATDIHDNISTCVQKITVIGGQPTLTSVPVMANADPGLCLASNVNIPVPTSDMPCAIVGNIVSERSDGQFKLLTDPYYVGLTTITWRAYGANNVLVASVTQKVTVSDIEGPVISGKPDDITAYTGEDHLTCDQVVSWTEPTASDVCEGVKTFFSRSHAPGDVFPVGTTTVTYVFKDSKGNSSTCTFDVTVIDNTPPQIHNGLLAASADSQHGNSQACTQIVDFTRPTATDNCGDPVAVKVSLNGVYFGNSLPADYLFPVGVTNVVYSFTDTHSNTSKDVITVTVIDNTPPVITSCPPSQTFCATNSYTIPALEASDPCGIKSIQYVISGATQRSGSGNATGSFNVGVSTINWVVTDNNDNINVCSTTVTVNPIPIATIGGDTRVCINASAPFVTFTGAYGTVPYAFTYSINDGSDQVITSTGNVATVSQPTGMPGTFKYTLKSVTDAKGCSQVQNGTATVNVNASLTAPVAGVNQTICYNATPAPLTVTTVASGGTGPFAYQWQSSTNGMTNWTNVGTGTSFAPGILRSTIYYRIIAADAGTPSCGSVTSNVVKVTVGQSLTQPKISSNQGVCYNTAPASITVTTPVTGGSGSYTYFWEVSTDNSTWLDIGYSGDSYTPSALTANTWYRVNGVDNILPTCGSVLSSNVVKITVQKVVKPGVIAGDQTICAGITPTAFTNTTLATGSGADSYQWQSSTAEDGQFTDITSATDPTYQPGSLTANTWFRRVGIMTQLSNSCSAFSNVLKVTVNPLPSAIAGDDRAICLNASTTLGAASEAGSTYIWSSVPEGSISTEANPTVSPAVNTTYTLVETIHATGCTNSHSVRITVHPLPAATAGADRAICLNGSTVLGAVEGNAYSWTSSDGLFTSNEANPTASPLVTTTYTVIETISATGCTNSHSVVVTVNPLPTVTLAPAGPFCINAAPVQLAGLPANGTYNGSGVSESGLFTPSEIGDHKITYAYTDDNGCTNSSSITITVNPRALLQTTINGVTVTSNNDGVDDTGAFSVCSSTNNVQFSVFNDLNGVLPAANVKAYQQIIKDNVTAPFCNNCAATLIGNAFRDAKGTVSLVNSSLPGKLTMKFRAFVDSNNNNIIDADECAGDWVIYTVTVNPVLQPSVSIEANTSETICAGTTVTFTATPVNGGITPQYQWRNGGVDIIGATEATYTSATLSDNDVISVEMTSSDVCAIVPKVTSNVLTMSVLPVITTSVNIVADPSESICNGTTVTFTATSVNGGLTPSYQWKNDGTNIPGATNDIYTSATLANNDAISVVMTSSEACVSGPATSNRLIMVVSPNLPVSVSIEASANPVCTGTSVTFTATPIQGGNAPIYQWYNGTMPVGSGTSTYSYLPVNGDKISVVMTSNLSACLSGSPATSNQVVMSVNPLPIVTLVPVGPFCIDGATVQLTGLPANGTYSGSGVSESGLFTPSVTGDHVITYTYTDENGCTNSASITITVNPRALLQTTINGVTVTSNNDGVDDTGAFSVCSSTNNVQFSVFNDLNGVLPAANVKAYQQIIKDNVTAPFCNNCAAPVSAFAGAKGTVALINSSLPGQLVMKFRAFVDSNNNNKIDGNECAGDWVIYTVTVNPPTGETVFTNGATAVCQDAINELYTATAANSTSIFYSVLPAEAGVINATTGVMNWDAVFSGTATIMAATTGLCGNTSANRAVEVNPLPIASINPPATTELTCSSTSISLTATGGGTYAWSLGTTALGTDATQIVTAPGTYTVTVTSDNGCSKTASILITENTSVPIAAINPPATTELTCNTASISLTATGGGTYAWSLGTTALGTDATQVATAPGTYTVTVTSENGCSKTAGILITENTSVPIAAINPPATTELTCSITSISLTATGGGTYVWSLGTTALGTDATQIVTAPGTYTVTVTSENGCSKTAGILITENTSVPIAAINPPATTELTCNTASISLTATGGGTYAWSLGATALGTDATQIVTAPGTYTVTVTSENGCSKTASIGITGNVAAPSVTLVAVGPFCIGVAPVQLTGLPAGGTYSGSDVNTSGKFTPSTIGDQVITYNYTNPNGCSSSASVTVTVYPRPQLQATINAVTVTDNDNGSDDTGTFEVCNSADNNLFFTQIADMNGVTPSFSVKVIQQFARTNVTFGPVDGIFPIGVFSPSFSRNVSLIDATQSGTLLMKLRTFFDINNNNVLDVNECAGDWIIYTVTVNPTTGTTNFMAGATTVCQNAANETYKAVADNSTSIRYSAIPTEAGIINANTGVMDWDEAFSGTATITATSTGLCGTTTANRVVIVNSGSVGGRVSGSSTICSGSNSGVLTLSGNIGTVVKWQRSVSPFSSWTDIANTATTYISGVLTQTTQFRAVVQSGSCATANSLAATVTVSLLPTTPVVSVVQPNCKVTTGTITVTAPLGTGLTYSINGGTYQGSNIFSGLASGNYTVKVKNAGGCVSVGTGVTINAQPAAITVSAKAGTISTFGGTTTLTASASGGVSPYTYALNGGTFQSANTFTVGAGTYTVNVRDVNGCTGTSNTVIISQPNQGNRVTTLTYTGDQTVQYGSRVDLSATLSWGYLGVRNETITFTIGSQSVTGVTNSFGRATATLLITQAPGNYSVVATFAGDANYRSSSYTHSFTVTRRSVTAGLVGTVSKVYDGSTSAKISPSNYVLTNTIAGDVVSLNNPKIGSFDNRNVGRNKLVTVNGLALTGVNAGRYTLTSTSVSARIGTITSSNKSAEIETDEAVVPAINVKVYPNPSHGPVTFDFNVSVNAKVTLDIFGSSGQRIARIFDANVDANVLQTVIFNEPLASGVYVYVLKWNDQVVTGKLIRTR